MTILHFWVLISIAFTVILFRIALPGKDSTLTSVRRFTLPVVFLLALIIRVIAAKGSQGFGADIGCFSAWADRMVEIGPSGFYSPDYFSDYPPLYLYLLYFVGFFRKMLNLEHYSPLHMLLLKTPAILSDLGIGYYLYRITRKHMGIASALAIASIFLFQPVVIMNSCLWGQIDSVYTLFLLMICLFLEKRQILPAFLVFGAGVLLKPQILIFSPLLIIGILLFLFEKNSSAKGTFLKKYFLVLGYALLTLILMLLAASPFGLQNVLSQYFSTLESYPYVSVNAYNFWTAVGLNWYSQNVVFLGLPCTVWGTMAIVLAAVICILIGLHFKDLPEKYALAGAFLILTVFCFSVRMHERYLYPAIPLLLTALPGLASRQLVLSSYPGQDRERVGLLTPSLHYFYPFLFVAITSLHFYNTAHILFFYDPLTYSGSAPILRLTGIGITLSVIGFYGLLLKLRFGKDLTAPAAAPSVGTQRGPLKFAFEKTRITGIDLILLLAVTLLYSLFALHDLGDRSAPESVCSLHMNDRITLQFPEDQPAVSFSYYIAPEHDRSFSVFCSETEPADPGKPADYTAQADVVLSSVFTWQTLNLPGASRFISMAPWDSEANIIELVFLDQDGKITVPLNAADYPELFDESELYPAAFSFRNSMYFDEIYHARTAYEFLHDMKTYENTHPPLGKILISVGIALFGMNPFGWRIIGTLFGIAMLPFFYLFAKKLTGDTPASALTTWLFAFDFMHFTQTRIATIDVYIVFFVICMYYFLYCFLCRDFLATSLERLYLFLALGGLSMGLGIACKWSGVYAGAGLGLLFFGHLIHLQRTYAHSRKSASEGVEAYAQFPKRVVKICLFCIIFFVLIPAVIYLFSYLPFRDGTDAGLLKRMLENQKNMLSYHNNLVATHYFASPYYEWPLIIRPIWYYSGVLSDGMREGISAFGNPLVWWLGIPAFLYMIYLSLFKKDRRALFLVIGYLAQYLPWLLVKRLTFIYHYFPCVVFLALMIGYSFRNLKEYLPRRRYILWLLIYGGIAFGLFLLFYPVLAGQPVNREYVKTFLKWFDTWVLIAD